MDADDKNDDEGKEPSSSSALTAVLHTPSQGRANEAEPHRFGDYEVTSVIGSGGCGIVYAAEHRILRRRAAVKVLRAQFASSYEMIHRFVREARTVNLIHHPNIIDIFDFGELPDGRPYYVMELLEGASLSELISQRGRFSQEEALAYFEQLCAALAATHKENIVHRDIKPSNVLVIERDGRPFLKLLDFGIAKLLQPDPGEPGLTQTGRLIGTPNFMAPEQILGTGVDQRTDIYSLGALLYCLLTGEHPFRGSPKALERQHLETPPPRPSASAPISPAVDAVVVKALAKSPADRFQRVEELIAAFRAALDVRVENEHEQQSRPAVAIYVEGRCVSAADLDNDDLQGAIESLVDAAEKLLEGATFQLPLLTATSVLGVQLAADPGESFEDTWTRTITHAESIYATIRGATDSRVAISIVVHHDEAMTRGQEIVGGPAMEMSRWLPNDRTEGVVALPVRR